MPGDPERENSEPKAETGELQPDVRCESVVTPTKRIRQRARLKPGKQTPQSLTESARVEILMLKAKGVDTGTLATRYNINHSSLSNWLNKYSDLVQEAAEVENFKLHRGDLLAAAQSRMLKYAVSDQKLAEAPLGQLATAIDKFHKAERLDRGLSTDNQSIKSFTRVVTGDKDPD